MFSGIESDSDCKNSFENVINVMSIVVETRKLVKTYMQGTVPVRALRGIDLQIAKGELVSILAFPEAENQPFSI